MGDQVSILYDICQFYILYVSYFDRDNNFSSLHPFFFYKINLSAIMYWLLNFRHLLLNGLTGLKSMKTRFLRLFLLYISASVKVYNFTEDDQKSASLLFTYIST